MKIGIDGYESNVSKRVGIGQYAYQLLKHLHHLDRANHYTIFLPSSPLPDLPRPRKGWQYIVGKKTNLWTILVLPMLIKKENLDIFFSPTHYMPWFTSLPKVLSVMDLSYMHYPEMFKTKDLYQLRYLGSYSIKHVQKILTISEFTKGEINKYYNPEADIIVTYPGFDSGQIPKKSDAKQKVKDLGRYILYVGTIQPRKNIHRLIKAFEQLNDKSIRLVLVGKKGWLYEPIFELIKNSSKFDLIVYLDYVNESELIDLYQYTECFVLPSLYEGFGLPVIEAMSYGCPVVVSNTTSLPEVAAEAGTYVDPFDPIDIAKGIKKALQLTPEARRKLIIKGYAQIKKFSWEKCARRTINVFNSLADSNDI